MAQDLTVNIKTTSDVPQAMEKSKTAVSGFDKQLADIGNKFKNSFKDIFLGFTAPMVILNGLMGMITSKIEEARRSAQEGFDLIASGETKFATSEQKKMANFLKVKAATEKEEKDVKEGKIEMTRKYLETDAGKKFLEDEAKERSKVSGRRERQLNPNTAVHYESIQKKALEAFLNSEEGKKFAPLFDDKGASKNTQFKGPEGFGSVIGVGANPVMEAMTRQTEVLEEIKAVLEASRPSGGGVPVPFTEGPASLRREFTT
jgi:hypothetical protein